MRRSWGLVVWCAVACLGASGWAGGLNLLPNLHRENFEGWGALGRWEATDPAQWKIGQAEEGNKVLSLFVKESKYQPEVRSPLSFTLFRGRTVADFMINVKMRSTAKEGPHRDLCVVFGYQGPTQFYYVHLASKADETAHHVMLVNGKDQTPITKERSEGVAWGDTWHNVRVIRFNEGSITVYFDDMEKPVLTAEDKTFDWGRVGVGSFDDTGDFDDFVLHGIGVEPPRSGPPPWSEPKVKFRPRPKM